MMAAQGIEADDGTGRPAVAPRRVGLIDLDPRAAATKWSRVEPAEDWQHVGAIISNPSDATGTAADIALPSKWHENLSIAPFAHGLSVIEAGAPEYAEFQLQKSLEGWDVDLIVAAG